MDEQKIAAKRELHRLALATALRDIVATLARRPEVERVILFGSYAAGRADLFTDLDILVVMDSAVDFVTRTAEMYRSLASPVDLDLIVYTPAELARNRGRPFIRQVLETGRVLYEKRTA